MVRLSNDAIDEEEQNDEEDIMDVDSTCENVTAASNDILPYNENNNNNNNRANSASPTTLHSVNTDTRVFDSNKNFNKTKTNTNNDNEGNLSPSIASLDENDEQNNISPKKSSSSSTKIGIGKKLRFNLGKQRNSNETGNLMLPKTSSGKRIINSTTESTSTSENQQSTNQVKNSHISEGASTINGNNSTATSQVMIRRGKREKASAKRERKATKTLAIVLGMYYININLVKLFTNYYI